MARTGRQQDASAWSYSTGERGKTRVRVFERADRPGIWIDYTDDDRHRHREPLGLAAGTDETRELAKAKADEIAAQFRRETKRRPQELTLGGLIDIYEREVTPTKSTIVQAHDRRIMPLFVRLWGRDRKPSTLSLRDWNAYIAERRAGRLTPAGKKHRRRLRDRALEQDLHLLQAMLNWATQAGDGKGGYLLERNPLKGLKAPSETAPCRPILSREQYAGVREHAAARSPRIECLVVIVWETGHRIGAVRQLRWSDIDLEHRRIHFRGELDKIGLDHWNPLSDEAVAILKRERTREPRIGDAWIFPSARDAEQPLTKAAADYLWGVLATAAKLPTDKRYGWHSLRRAFANRLRRAPLKDLQGLGGWKHAGTLLNIYLQHDEDAQREALQADRAAVPTQPAEAKG